MAGTTRNITLYIFLFSFFLLLALVIGVRIYNIYTTSKTTSESTIESTMGCAFSFSISNIEYSEGTLGFDLKTSDENMFKKLVVVGENNEQGEVELGQFIGYRQRVYVSGIPITDSFLVYPYGCKGQNKKECQLSTGRCENA